MDIRSLTAFREILEGETQSTMKNLLLKLKIWKDQSGQDLIEYALMAGFGRRGRAVMPAWRPASARSSRRSRR
jgi:hypothetical protein